MSRIEKPEKADTDNSDSNLMPGEIVLYDKPWFSLAGNCSLAAAAYITGWLAIVMFFDNSGKLEMKPISHAREVIGMRLDLVIWLREPGEDVRNQVVAGLIWNCQ